MSQSTYASMAGPFRATGRSRSAETKRSLICVVDDSESSRTLVTAVLERRGIDVVAVADGQAMDEVLAAGVIPGLFILGLSLPGESGADILRRLRSDLRWASVPILACSGDAMVGDAGRELADGFDAYLAKPVDIGTLIWAVIGFLKNGRRPGDQHRGHDLTGVPMTGSMTATADVGGIITASSIQVVGKRRRAGSEREASTEQHTPELPGEASPRTCA
jgi:CheY-like chemotaxis protein